MVVDLKSHNVLLYKSFCNYHYKRLLSYMMLNCIRDPRDIFLYKLKNTKRYYSYTINISSTDVYTFDHLTMKDRKTNEIFLYFFVYLFFDEPTKNLLGSCVFLYIALFSKQNNYFNSF